MAKKSTASVHKVYKYYGKDYIKKDGYAWSLYRYYSSKKAAHNGLMSVMRSFGKDIHGDRPMRVIKVNRGGAMRWGVFQLPKKGFRTKSDKLSKLAKKSDKIF